MAGDIDMDSDEVSKAQFTIAYDGSAIRDGSMDVRDLAPALLAVGQLFDAANRALNGPDAPQITVNVQATRSGSFEIALEVVQSFLEAAKSFLLSDNVTAALTLKELVLTGAAAIGSLLGLLRWLRGRKPDRLEKLGGDMIRITVDGESIVVPLKLLRLYQDIAVREAVESLVVKPLSKDGIDVFKVIEAGETTEQVRKLELESFIAPEAPTAVVVESVHKSAFSIVSLAFKEDNKWRLHDGNHQISATIEDADFLHRVDSNLIRFAKGDILVCEVKIRQLQTGQGLKTDYTVIHVIQHLAAPRQIDLFVEDQQDEESPQQQVLRRDD